MVNFRQSPPDKFKQSFAASEAIALKALVYLANHQDDCERFFALSGLGADDLRSRAGEPDFLAGVLDFVLEDERLLLRFAESEGIQPEVPAMARRGLMGGQADAEY